MTPEQRLRLDIATIGEQRERTSTLSEQKFRWEGTEVNPNGWRLLGDMANDVGEILEERERMLDVMEDISKLMMSDDQSEEDIQNVVIRVEEFTDNRKSIDPSTYRDTLAEGPDTL